MLRAYVSFPGRTSRWVSTSLRKNAGKRGSELDEQDLSEARQWLGKLTASTIPRSPGEISFARSQGAGGQHVNKTESKATLRYPMRELQKVVPKLLHAPLRASRYYIASSDSLRITIEEQRQQRRNVEGCWDRLYWTLKEVGKAEIPGETSQVQEERVTRLKKAENESRLRLKKMVSEKKKGRSKSSNDY